MPTRSEIQQRRIAIAESVRHYHREFNRGVITVATCLEYLQAECDHPPEAIVKDYKASHFDVRCGDCGKLLPRPTL